MRFAGYDLTDPNAITNNTVTRKVGAQFFIPSEDQWYKAAYFDPSKAGGDGYWPFPTQSDAIPTIATADGQGNIDNDNLNIANYNRGADWNGKNGNVTTVGSGGPGSGSFYRAFDMGGNVWEWNEALASSRGLRGGSWDVSSVGLQSSFFLSFNPTFEDFNVGFRVASP
jgi:sulfatase modifying factor 1